MSFLSFGKGLFLVLKVRLEVVNILYVLVVLLCLVIDPGEGLLMLVLSGMFWETCFGVQLICVSLILRLP